mgnify:FL=1
MRVNTKLEVIKFIIHKKHEVDGNYLDVEMIDIKLVREVTFKVLLIKKYQIIIKRVIKKANYEQSTFILIIYRFY